jgi:hypothetical protein
MHVISKVLSIRLTCCINCLPLPLLFGRLGVLCLLCAAAAASALLTFRSCCVCPSLQVPTNPPSAEPLYLKVAVFQFGGFRSMHLAQAGHVEAKRAVEQQLMAVLTGKVRPSTKWSKIGW